MSAEEIADLAGGTDIETDRGKAWVGEGKYK
jgi:hypothetical protein